MASTRAFQFERKVEQALVSTGIPFEREPRLVGLVPGFLVKARSGRPIVIEVKSWLGSKRVRRRAIQYAARYRDLLGKQEFLLVVDGIANSDLAARIITLKDLPGLLRLRAYPGQVKYAAKRTSWATGRQRKSLRPKATAKFSKKLAARKQQPILSRAKRIVFAAMPFDRKYDDVFFVAMSGAAKYLKVACDRIDQSEFTGDVVTEIKKRIGGAAAVIADLSQAKPNVLYEVGYCHGRNKKTIHICSTPLSKLPFDVKTWNTIPYRQGQTHALKKVLIRRLKAALNGGR